MALKDKRVEQGLRSCGSEFQMCGPERERERLSPCADRKESGEHRVTSPFGVQAASPTHGRQEGLQSLVWLLQESGPATSRERLD